MATTTWAATVLAPSIAVVLAASPGWAQERDMRAAADAIVQAAYPADGPGAAVIITRGERVVYAGARGLADTAGARPITPDTVFRLGSITKQFTAAVVLQLVADGMLSLNDPVSRFFPDWPEPAARATVRQLLNHNSGIQDATKIPGYMLSEPTMRPNSTAELLRVIRARPAVSAPGQRWEYNNSGYVVLGAIIEAVTGKTWHEVVDERIARPLELTTLAYADAAAASPAMARGYSDDGGQPRLARGVHISVAHAAGGLVASAADLARWARALHGGRVVSPALYREMIAPAPMANGSTETYGFGLRLRTLRGRPALVHGGAGRGIDTDSAYLPGEQLFVAVLANSDDPRTDPATLVRRLGALALGEPVPAFSRVDVPRAAIAPLFGTYGVENGPPRRFFARAGRLFVGRGDDEQEVFAVGGDRFVVGADALNWFGITRPAGSAPVMELHRVDARGPETAMRTGDVPPALTIAPAVLQSYVGSYATEGPVLTVTLVNGGLAIAPAGQTPMPMRPVSDAEFRIEGGIMRVVFHPENGAVDRLTLYRGARELHGRRAGR